MAFRTFKIFSYNYPIIQSFGYRNANYSSLQQTAKCILTPPNCMQSVRKQGVREFKKSRDVSIRSKDPNLNPEPGEYKFMKTANYSCLIRPLGFTIAVTACSFVGAAIAQYEMLRTIVKPKSFFDNNPKESAHYGKPGSIVRKIHDAWSDFDTGQKIGVMIISANFGVFALWRVPMLRRVMQKYFTSNPMTAAPCTSMLLSSYSHYSFIHFAMNMYVLWSFIPTITRLLGPEQFMAFYTSAAVWSSLASYAYRVSIRSLVPSVGASGAIIAILGAVCYYYPESRLSIAFIGEIYPHSFTANTALYSMIGLDTLGLLLRWKMLDHAAHLGGVFFGIWYLAFGHTLIWKNREPLMKIWHDIRGRP